MTQLCNRYYEKVLYVVTLQTGHVTQPGAAKKGLTSGWYCELLEGVNYLD